jgi:hypothetical protein
MTISISWRTALLAGGMGAGLAAGAAQASTYTIDRDAWLGAGCVGANTCVVEGATITAGLQSGDGSTSTLVEQNFNNTIGLGVNTPGQPGDGEPRSNELQGPNQSPYAGGTWPGQTITMDFSIASRITDTTLAFLYNPDTFASDPQEIAFIDGYLDGTFIGNFQLQTNTNDPNDPNWFTWAGADNVERTAPFSGQNQDQGRFEISGLFGGALVDQLVFRAGGFDGIGETHDYAIESVTVSPIPLPAAGWLLIGGIGTLIAVRRRQKAAA